MRRSKKTQLAATGGSLAGAAIATTAVGATKAGRAFHNGALLGAPTPLHVGVAMAGGGLGAGLGAHLTGADLATTNTATLAGAIAPGIGPALAMQHPTYRSGHAAIGGRHNERDISKKKASLHRLYYMRHTGQGVKRVKYTYPDK